MSSIQVDISQKLTTVEKGQQPEDKQQQVNNKQKHINNQNVMNYE